MHDRVGNKKPFRKQDSDKPSVELLPFVALERVGAVLRFGAKKYSPGNWRKVDKRTRYLGAALRHLFAWARGEDLDPESGLSHLDHAACSVLMLSEAHALGLGEDDRAQVTLLKESLALTDEE